MRLSRRTGAWVRRKGARGSLRGDVIMCEFWDLLECHCDYDPGGREMCSLDCGFCNSKERGIVVL